MDLNFDELADIANSLQTAIRETKSMDKARRLAALLQKVDAELAKHG